MPIGTLFHFVPNLYTLAMSMTGAAVLGFGIWVLSANRHDRMHKDFFLLCGVLSGWLLTQSAAFSAVDKTVATWLTLVPWAFVLFLPAVTTAFHLNILGMVKERKRGVAILSVGAAIFLPLLFFSGFVDRHNTVTYPWAIIPMAGPLNYIFLLAFATTLIYQLAQFYRHASDPSLSERDRHIYRLSSAAIGIGLFGLIDWLPYLGLNVPPVGFLPVAIWIGLFVYAIFRYRLLRLTPETAAPAIIEALPGALFVVNADGEIIVTNPGLKDLVGQAADSFIGQNIRTLIPAADETIKCAQATRDASACSLDGLETELIGTDGKRIPVSLSVRSVRRPDGALDGLVFIAVGIGELKKQVNLAEEQRAALARNVEEMQQAHKLMIEREKKMMDIKHALEELKRK